MYVNLCYLCYSQEDIIRTIGDVTERLDRPINVHQYSIKLLTQKWMLCPSLFIRLKSHFRNKCKKWHSNLAPGKEKAMLSGKCNHKCVHYNHGWYHYRSHLGVLLVIYRFHTYPLSPLYTWDRLESRIPRAGDGGSAWGSHLSTPAVSSAQCACDWHWYCQVYLTIPV